MKKSNPYNNISFAEKRLLYASQLGHFEGVRAETNTESREEEPCELNAEYFYQYAANALNHYLNDNSAELGAKLFPLKEDESGEHLKQRKIKDIAEKLNVALNRDKLKQVLQNLNETDKTLLIRGLAYEAAESICNNMILEDQANKDHLTKLPNKRAFEERLKEVIAQQSRHAIQFCLLMIDLDKFKEVNGECGHPAGDEVLIEIGRRFNKILREYDFVARYGGDEFVMILPSTNPDAAGKAAFRIIEEISKPITVKNGKTHTVEVGATIGVGKYEGNDPDGTEVIRSADNSLMHLKNNDLRGNAAYKEKMLVAGKEGDEEGRKVTIQSPDNTAQPIRGGVIDLAVNQ